MMYVEIVVTCMLMFLFLIGYWMKEVGGCLRELIDLYKTLEEKGHE